MKKLKEEKKSLVTTDYFFKTRKDSKALKTTPFFLFDSNN